jgi:FkbM family methyltransferase
MSLRSMADKVQHALARSSLAAHAAMLVRNQCNAVLAFHLNPSLEWDENGEAWLCREVGRGARRFIDVGAHKGDWTANLLKYASADVEGLAFEPIPKHFERLRGRMASEWPSARVELVRKAVSDAAGQAEMFEEPIHGWSSSLVSGDAGAPVHTVDVTTVDDEVSARGWSTLDIMKVDAEGFDLHVIRGAERLLRAGELAVLQFEYSALWAGAGSTLANARAYLTRFGYTTFILRQDYLAPFDFERFGEYFRFTNFVA